jgi:hypothetical protein
VTVRELHRRRRIMMNLSYLGHNLRRVFLQRAERRTPYCRQGGKKSDDERGSFPIRAAMGHTELATGVDAGLPILVMCITGTLLMYPDPATGMDQFCRAGSGRAFAIGSSP